MYRIYDIVGGFNSTPYNYIVIETSTCDVHSKISLYVKEWKQFP